MGRFASSSAEVVLRLAAGLSLVVAALWVLGHNGAGLVNRDLPGRGEDLVTAPSLTSWDALPSAPATLVDRADRDALYDLTLTLGAKDSGLMPDGYAEIGIGTFVQLFDPTTGERWLWVGVHVATWVGIAGLWWLLAGIAKGAGQGSPFTASNARRLTLAGGLLVVGSIASSLAQHLVSARMLATSSVGDRVEPVSYDFFSLPWAAIAVGGALVAIARAWSRGVELESDVKGLV
jgi:hypothetical protein